MQNVIMTSFCCHRLVSLDGAGKKQTGDESRADAKGDASGWFFLRRGTGRILRTLKKISFVLVRNDPTCRAYVTCFQNESICWREKKRKTLAVC